jgi:anthranilate synthase component I
VRILPSLSQFERLASGVTHVPVWGELLSDRDTPVTAFRKLHRGRHGCLLESALGGEKWGRYSFVVTEPAAVIRARGARVEVEARNGSVERLDGVDPLLFLRQILGRYRTAAVPGLPRFTGGLVGYLAYDAVRWIERLPAPEREDLGFPDLYLLLADTLLVFDSQAQKILVLTHADVAGAASPADAYAAAVARIEELATRLDAPAPALGARFETTERRVEPDGSNLTPEQYADAVARAKEYIAAGDIIQVVLAQRFWRETRANAFDIYRCLRTINPSPYLYHLELDGLAVVGASPEVMVRLEDGVMTVRPIAGTHWRAASPEEDERLARALAADPKERAEHVMLLDLGRNDIGRVAIPGTVEVTERFAIERYSHVMHLVSNVQGRVAPGFDAIDAFRAAFPAGTLSGAPKVRAMQIIDELEPTRRGIYGGAVGHFGFGGAMDTCITIRTAVVTGGRVYVQAGAGIVADSNPATEQEECARKARAVMAAVEMAETLA